MLILLGFDSFDAERVTHFDTPQIDQLPESGTLHTPAGLESAELSTVVLWASMLAGQHPKEMYPEYYDETTDGGLNITTEGRWNTRLLNQLSSANLEERVIKILPSRVNQFIKRHLSSAGIKKESYVEARLSETHSILDVARNPKVISLPGVNWDASNEELKTLISPRESSDGESYIEIDADPRIFERQGMNNDIDRLLRTIYAVESREHDFLFTHFFSLDLAQHIWSRADDKMQRWYGFYDYLLKCVRDTAGPDDTIVIVSDHGMLESGIHSKRAFYGASVPIWGDVEEYRTEDLFEVLEAELKRDRHEPTDTGDAGSLHMTDETADHLRDLGYF